MAEIEEKQELKGNISINGTIVATSITEKGEQGKKGEAFKYEDFTAEQLEKLKGEKGNTGEQGPRGEMGPAGPQGPQGEKGDSGKNGTNGENGATFIPNVDEEGNLTWSNDKNLPNPELINIKGKQGEKGEAFKYEDFTSEQLEKLKGEKGNTGEQGPRGEMGPVGPQGPQGEKGDPGGVNSINGLQGDIVEKHYNTTLTENLTTTELEIPAKYEVGTDCLHVYFEGDLLEKDIHYEEVGEPNSISNKIKIDWLTNWKEETGEEELIFSFIVQGTYEEASV